MPKDSFREKIVTQLETMSSDDVRFFAYVCAVRVLPFLGGEGDFSFWTDDKSQQLNLLTVFRTLDAVAIQADTDIQNLSMNGISRSDTSAMYLAYLFATVTNMGEANIALLKGSAHEGVFAAVSAAYFAELVAGINLPSYNFKDIFFQDIDDIKSGKELNCCDVSMYGDIWDNFYGALKNVGCEYWAQWYKRLFYNKFRLSDADKSEIFMRLNNPYKSIEYGAADVAKYIRDVIKFGNKRLNEMRILVLGEKGAGKTSLARRLKKPTERMPRPEESTAGVDIINWDISIDGEDKEDLNVHIWDFAGHVITHAVHRCFMSERCLYILVINGRTAGDNRNEYWLEQIRSYGGNSPILVVVNVKDDHYVDIPQNTLKREFPSIVDFYQLNILEDREALEGLRQKVLTLLRENPIWKNQHISLPVFKVKETINKYFDNGEYVDYDIFAEIAKSSEVSESDYMPLMQFLNDLGICVAHHPKNSAAAPILLNPIWISYGIYRIINYGLNNQKHVISRDMFSDVFVDTNRYTQDKASLLFEIMAEYQLAFFLKDDSIFVPLLLPIDRPGGSQLPQFPFGERLRMVYEANMALPPYSVARLAVLLSDSLDVNASWRYGAVFRMGSTIALAEENERMRTVTVTVKGEASTKLLSLMRKSLDSIFNEYKDGRPELKYEVLLPPGWNEQENRPFFRHDELKNFIQSEDLIIGNADAGQKIIIGNRAVPPIDPGLTVAGYDIFSIQRLRDFCLKNIDEINQRLKNTSNLTDSEISDYEKERAEFEEKIKLIDRYENNPDQSIWDELRKWYHEKM